ncbi:hypothetical protein [Micromonospora yangpuensis]|uniref:Uncharacterized protein n=1 Tax=Micromonospora yangpuensis TaxID=683228 RepID=A0A1C6VDP0_9ACTN|nr:hypothetical protein [Micromonospora yangpuensis]GGM14087.1 hypothetical protein GCM10012279_35280 [Micromonospora yangpuensis]SCL64479.1 hypothetical protein GA0070617_5483 [Micromonospora yangpuensis]
MNVKTAKRAACLCGHRDGRHRMSQGSCKDCDCDGYVGAARETADRAEPAADEPDPAHQALREHLAEVKAALRDLQVQHDQLQRDKQGLIQMTHALANEIGRLRGGGDLVSSWDAHLCEKCGSRYTVAYTDHECGPLTPVTVQIRRQRPAASERYALTTTAYAALDTSAEASRA